MRLFGNSLYGSVTLPFVIPSAAEDLRCAPAPTQTCAVRSPLPPSPPSQFSHRLLRAGLCLAPALRALTKCQVAHPIILSQNCTLQAVGMGAAKSA